MSDMTRADHYARAEELLDTAETIKAMVTRHLAGSPRYTDDVNALQSCLLFASVHATLATASDEVFRDARVQGILAEEDEPSPAARAVNASYIDRLERLIREAATPAMTMNIYRTLVQLHSRVPSERARGRNAARSILAGEGENVI